MPESDSGDRVYNFFPPDNLIQGNHHQQTIEGTWSATNNNFWVGGQIGLPNTSIKNDNIQHSVTSRGQGGHSLHGQSGLNFTHTSSNFAQSFIKRQQLNPNGNMFGNHANQTKQDEANIMVGDTISDHQNLVSRGLSRYELHQGPGFHQHQTKPLVRSETSESPLTFNLFGNQQQMHYPQSSMPQSFQKQQSGFSDMQQLQQQIMLRKMQELQGVRQPDSLQLNVVNPISPFSKQLTGSYPSAMVNGPLRADSQDMLWGPESGNTNWLQRASSVVQGSLNGFVTSANGQAQSSVSSGMQQGDHSVYGDTFSGSRGNLTQFSEMTTGKPSMEQVVAFSNNTSANQYQACVDQTSMQEKSMTSRLGFPGENPFCNPPGQYAQQINPMKRIMSSQEIHHDVARCQDKALSEDAASLNEVSLDPTEARILYGSEDNIWAAFGKSLDDCGEAGGPFDQLQSGTWSALMQSAVAETSSNDVGQHEELGSPSVLQNEITDLRPAHGSVVHSGVPETNRGSYRGPWPPGHSGFRDQYGNSSVYNPSAAHFSNAAVHDPGNPSLHSQGYGQNTVMTGEVGHGGFPFNSCPMPMSVTEVDHAKSLSGNTPVTRGGSIASNAAVTPNLMSTHSNESSQAMLWRNINSTVLSYGSGSVDRPYNHIELENQRVDSSLNSLGQANTGTGEMDNCKQNDSSNNSYCSDLSHNNSSGGVKEIAMSDVGDSHSLPSGKKKYLNHNKIGQGNLGSQKFQYDSMGNVDEDTQRHHTSTSQIFGFQLGPSSHGTSLPSQSFISQESLQKGNKSHQGQDTLDIGERLRSQFPSSPGVHSLPHLGKREFSPNRSALPEQVNHAFVHKIPGSNLSASSSDFPRSRTPFQYHQVVKESGQASRNQHDVSHSIQKNDLVSRSSIGQTTNTMFRNAAWNSQLDNQVSAPESHLHLRELVPPTSANDVSVSQAMNRNAQHGTSFEMLPQMGSNILKQPHSLSSHSRRTSSNVWQLHQPNVLESNYFPHKHGEIESVAGRISPSVSGSSSMNRGSPAQQDSTGKVNMAQGDELQKPEPASNNFFDSFPSDSVSMQKDIEAFGQSLMSNSSHQNYSLLHQMGIMKSAETDPYERARKRLKSSGSVGECQQLISMAAKSIDNAVGQHASVSSGDFKILSFSGPADNAGSIAYAQHGSVISQNIHSSNQENSRFNHDGNDPIPVKVDHLSISPQMTPSWLIQHGGSMTGHVLTGYDARKVTGTETAKRLFSNGKSLSGVHMSNSNEPVAAADISIGNMGNIQQSPIPISTAVEPQTLMLNLERSNKRERATFRLTSWGKEVSLESRNPQTISMAELHWAKAANRLMEKIEDEVKFSEDGLPILRAKRRVMLTTQLMQQLLSPPKSAILSSEAELNFDDVAYSVSRLALGEACGLLPNLNSDSDKSHHVVSLVSGNSNEPEKGNEQHLSRLVEGFMGRAQKLESDLLRLDNRASLLDVRSECQELEKFSVINRFAKFHGRGQTQTGDASSSNGSANALRRYPQRYVTALPVPRNIPDRVHCLSL